MLDHCDGADKLHFGRFTPSRWLGFGLASVLLVLSASRLALDFGILHLQCRADYALSSGLVIVLSITLNLLIVSMNWSVFGKR